MTNRQWLAGLSDEALLETLNAYGMSCPPCEQNCNTPKNCKKCWLDWLRAESDKPTSAVYDVVEEHHGCMVQVLKNSVTGEMSVGWMRE